MTAKPTPLAAAAVIVSLALAGCSGGNDDPQPAPSTEASATDAPSTGAPATAENSPTAEASDPLPEDADLSTVSPPITPDEAIATAVKEAGDGIVHAVELDYDERAGAWRYEVKILSGSTDHDIDVDAQTGEVVAAEAESTNDQETAIDLNDPMTWDDAHGLASAQGSGRLSGWKLESDDGRIEYQFDYDDNGQEKEVTVDVETKRVTVDD